jgi:hypothetical protein
MAATGAVIVHGGDRAYYKPSEDRIQLPPPEKFRSSEFYYARALHELTHWSGLRSRLEGDLMGYYRCAGPRLWQGGSYRRGAGGGDRSMFISTLGVEMSAEPLKELLTLHQEWAGSIAGSCSEGRPSSL